MESGIGVLGSGIQDDNIIKGRGKHFCLFFQGFRKLIQQIIDTVIAFLFDAVLQFRVILYLFEIERGDVFDPQRPDNAAHVFEELSALDEYDRRGQRGVVVVIDINDSVTGDVLDAAQTHDAGGTADARNHGAGPDLQGLIPGQGSCHVEDDLPRLQFDLQLSPGLFDDHGGVHIQLDGFGVIQADIGIAFVAGSHGVTAVQPHVLGIGDDDAAGVFNGDAAFRKLQPHDGSFGTGS